MWNMLAGLVKLSESVQQVVNDVKALERKLDAVAQNAIPQLICFHQARSLRGRWRNSE